VNSSLKRKLLTEAGKEPAALFSIAAVSAKLALTEWLVNRGWRPF
jgi:triphosphatase